jgi:hypothetical protein
VLLVDESCGSMYDLKREMSKSLIMHGFSLRMLYSSSSNQTWLVCARRKKSNLDGHEAISLVAMCLELLKLFLRASSFRHFQHIESNCFAQWSTFTDGHHITVLYVTKTRTQVNGHVLVSFLKTIVLPYVVQVIATNDDGTCHFQFHHGTSENTTANADVTGEWAFLVDIGAFNGLDWACFVSFEPSKMNSLHGVS